MENLRSIHWGINEEGGVIPDGVARAQRSGEKVEARLKKDEERERARGECKN